MKNPIDKIRKNPWRAIRKLLNIVAGLGFILFFAAMRSYTHDLANYVSEAYGALPSAYIPIISEIWWLFVLWRINGSLTPIHKLVFTIIVVIILCLIGVQYAEKKETEHDIKQTANT